MRKTLLTALGLSLILALTVSAVPKFDPPYDRVQELACEILKLRTDVMCWNPN